MGENAQKRGKKLIIAFKIEDENGNDITPDNAVNSVETGLSSDVEIKLRDYTNIAQVISSIFNRIGEKILIRHLFPRYPHKVPTELCSNDPDKFSYFVEEYYWTHTKF